MTTERLTVNGKEYDYGQLGMFDCHLLAREFTAAGDKRILDAAIAAGAGRPEAEQAKLYQHALDVIGNRCIDHNETTRWFNTFEGQAASIFLAIDRKHPGQVTREQVLAAFLESIERKIQEDAAEKAKATEPSPALVNAEKPAESV